jgi:hypothetical protein
MDNKSFCMIRRRRSSGGGDIGSPFTINKHLPPSPLTKIGGSLVLPFELMQSRIKCKVVKSQISFILRSPLCFFIGILVEILAPLFLSLLLRAFEPVFALLVQGHDMY